METENESRLAALWGQVIEKVQEDPNYQKLRSKYDELDPQSKLYLRTAGIVVPVLAFIGILVGAGLGARAVRSDWKEKMALIELLQNAQNEMRELREKSNAPASAGRSDTPAPWSPYLESQASQNSIPKESMTIAPEREGKSTDQTREALIDVQLKKINIKQLARYSSALEKGSRPVKIRAMTIDAQSDSSGYIDANLALSAFNPK